MSTKKVEIAGPQTFPNSKCRKYLTGCKTCLIFKPLVWMLRLSALVLNTDVLCDEGRCTSSNNFTSQAPSPRKPKLSVRRCSRLTYMAIIHTLSWANTLRLWSCFRNFGFAFNKTESQLHITCLIMFTGFSLASTALMCQFSTRLANLPNKLCLIKRKYGLTKDWSLSRKSKVGVVLTGCLVLGVICGFVPTAYVYSELHIFAACPFELEEASYWNSILTVWFGTMTLFAAVGMFAALFIYHWFCSAVCYLFDQCSHELRKINTKETTTSRALQKSMDFHGDICEWLTMGNDIFKYFVFGTYFVTLPVICFFVNIIWKVENNILTFAMSLIMVIVMIICLLIVVVPAIKVNARVTQAREDVFKLDWKSATKEDLQLASFFANKTFHPNVAITVADLLEIDKGHLLTLLSMLVTYSVLIAQFTPPSLTSQGCLCNNNSSTLE